MSTVIRRGVFETNSSSEHAVAIAKKSDFQAWKEGRMYARLLVKTEKDGNTWGNFWSELQHWVFKALDEREVEAANMASYSLYVARMEEEYEKMLAYRQTSEKYRIGENEYFKDDGDKEKFLKNYDQHLSGLRSEIDAMSYDKIDNVDKLHEGFWLSYDEFMDALRHDDVYSPFYHEDGDTVVFGTYFHS